MDTHTRSVLKAVSYRVFGTAATFAISYVFTGSAAVSGGIALSETLIKLALYYVHERLWSKVK